MTTELRSYRDTLANLVKKLLQQETKFCRRSLLSLLVCNNYIAEEETSAAKDLVDRFLEHFPGSTQVQFYKRLLTKPGPGEISQQERKEIEEQVLSEMADPIERALRLRGILPEV